MSDWSLDYGNEQHIGSRKEQQDYFASFPPEMEVVMSDRGFLVVVADGMGGHSDGAKASVLAVNVFLEEYKAAITRLPVIEALKHSLGKSNKSICGANIKTGPQSDMGSTLVACVLRHNVLFWISIGDSRIYIVRGGTLQCVNEEHSIRAEMEKKNPAYANDVRFDSKTKHMLTSYLGIENIKKVDYSKAPFEMKPGDSVLLCTDGLFKALSENEILQCLEMDTLAQKKCEILIEKIARKKIPNQDNTTIVLFCLKERSTKPSEAPSAHPPPLANEEAVTYAANYMANNAINDAANDTTDVIIQNPDERQSDDQETEAATDSRKLRKSASKTKYIVAVVLSLIVLLIIAALWYFAK